MMNGHKSRCEHSSKILAERADTRDRIKSASAEKMKTKSLEKYVQNYDIGDTVMVPIPKVDRGPSDPPNLIGVILDRKNDVYQVGCKAGVLKGYYGPETLIRAKTSLLSIDAVDRSTVLSLRQSVNRCTGGQGYSKCNCKASRRQCGTRKCSCFANNVLCNSRCHGSLTCENK